MHQIEPEHPGNIHLALSLRRSSAVRNLLQLLTVGSSQVLEFGDNFLRFKGGDVHFLTDP